jgi:anti-sigma regulatory factor (Ser/Thr protein kinase)
VSRVIEVPETLDHKGFEQLVAGLNRSAEIGGERLVFNAKHVRWTSPYGLIGLLAVGRVARDRTGLAPRIEAPDSRDVRRYWDRMDFWHVAHQVYDLEPVSTRAHGASDALLEITAIQSHHDVHAVVERVRERAAAILENRLHYPKPSVIHFSVMLSEVCQNIIEHAEADGWVCAQTYHYRERLGRDVLMLAVGDVGIGFEGSLAAEHARRHGEGWSAAAALEAALLHGESRFRDPGRGQGLQAIRRQVGKWDGMLGIRSGNAMIALVPEWETIPPLQRGLEGFPGAQILVVMPARPEGEGLR